MRGVFGIFLITLVLAVGMLWGYVIFGDEAPKAPRECIQQSHSVSEKLPDEGWVYDSRTTYTGQCTILGGVE